MTGSRTIVSIQYLRALAALTVVLHHARNPDPGLFDPLSGFNIGVAGVYVFFVISGFIMYRVGRTETPLRFLYRRIVRVVPLYWICTTIAAVLLYKVQDWAPRAHEFFMSYVYSLFFIPHYSLKWPDELWPILIPGWTLNYEMFFYAIFALSLAVGAVMLVNSVVILALVAVGALVAVSGPVLLTYTDYILLYFLMGLFIGWMYDTRDLSRWGVCLPLGAALILLAIAFGGRAEDLLLFIGAPLVVLGGLANEPGLARWNCRLLHRLGDASYSIYLTHALFIFVLRAVFVHHMPYGWLQFTSWIATALISASLVGLLVHHWVEVPLTRALSGRGKRAAVV